MKTLLFNSVILILVLCSCSGSRSFMHQRYTSLGHSKHKTTVGTPHESYAGARKSTPAPVAEPVMVTPVPDAITAAPEQKAEPAPMLVASANSAASHAAASPKLVKNTTFRPLKTFSNSDVKSYSKQLKKEQKRGLLFGVIDALLSIILLVIFVALVVFLILILI